MKQIISLIVVLLITLVGVTAMEDIEVDCDRGWWDSNICRDYELQDEVDEIVDGINDVEAVVARVDAKPDMVGGGGIGMYTVAEYLGWPGPSKEFNFVRFLKSIFMPRYELYNQIDILQAQIKLLEADREINTESLSRETKNVKRIREENQGNYICYFNRPCVFISE